MKIQAFAKIIDTVRDAHNILEVTKEQAENARLVRVSDGKPAAQRVTIRIDSSSPNIQMYTLSFDIDGNLRGVYSWTDNYDDNPQRVAGLGEPQPQPIDRYSYGPDLH